MCCIGKKKKSFLVFLMDNQVYSGKTSEIRCIVVQGTALSFGIMLSQLRASLKPLGPSQSHCLEGAVNWTVDVMFSSLVGT